MVLSINNVIKMMVMLLILSLLLPICVNGQHKSIEQLFTRKAEYKVNWYGKKNWSKDSENAFDYTYQWYNKAWKNNTIFVDGIYASIIKSTVDRKFNKEEKSDRDNFFSQIDSLNVINYENDTIYHFQNDGQYLLESCTYFVTKSYHWTLPKTYPRRDSLICRKKDSLSFRVSWVPMYLRMALIEEDFEFLSTLCEWSDKQKSIFIGGDEFYSPTPHFVYHKVIIKDGKIHKRVKFDFVFSDIFNTFDDIYAKVEKLNLKGKILPSNGVCHKNKISKIGMILDSIYHKAPYQPLLECNEKIEKWEKQYVIPLIDSLNLIDYQNDTLYYELCYNKDGIGKNRANILTNSKRMYVYESFDGVVWDTLSGVDRVKYVDVVYKNFYTEMQNRYVLYDMPVWPMSSRFLNSLTDDWREFYYKESALFRVYNNDKYLINSSEKAKQYRKLNRAYDGVRIRSRIEFKDGQVVNVITQMRLSDNNLW